MQQDGYYGGSYGQQLSTSVPDYAYLNASAPSSSSPSLGVPNAPPYSAYAQEYAAREGYDTRSSSLAGPNSSYSSSVVAPYVPAVPAFERAYNYGVESQGYGGVEEGAQAMTLGYGAPSLEYGQQEGASIYAEAYQGGYGSGYSQGQARIAGNSQGQVGNSSLEGSASGYESKWYDGVGVGSDEVFVYYGGRGGSEPYGARGTGASSWSSGESAGGNYRSSWESGNGTIASREVSEADAAKDSGGGGGVQKYWVKLLPETSSTPPKEVICQIGLDGVRMVDPSTSRMLRIYPLETITRWEVNEPSMFTFWAKSAVDFEQRTIRLQSSTHTINAILDTITAACVQLCEMVGKDGPSDNSKLSDSTGTGTDVSRQQKGSIVDWVSLRPRAVSEEEKQHWIPDEAVSKCSNCETEFSAFIRRHHCRNCGDIFCDKCTRGRTALTAEEDAQVVRVCDCCLGEVMQRLSNMETSSKTTVQHTHEDLAKKLQEELERNTGRRAASSSQSSSMSNNANSSDTSVLNCTKCGSISLVPSSSTQCPSCGSKVLVEHGRGQDSGTGSFGSSPQSSSHFWSNSPAPQGSGPCMQEVACPTCTVHLQVQIPSSGTETVECGVCQHPFLVNAN